METPQNQKQALRRLAALSKLIPIEKFYSITVSRWGNVSLQGEFDREVVIFAIRNKFTAKASDDMGYVRFIRGRIDINLV